MNEDELEAVAIANLIAADEDSIVGWVYRWNTGALAIRWDVEGPQRVERCEPDLNELQKREIDFDVLTRIAARSGGRG